jgi:hypothetical protein
MSFEKAIPPKDRDSVSRRDLGPEDEHFREIQWENETTGPSHKYFEKLACRSRKK